jgi:RNA polymerase sigma-70 factor (ECF subfamily)
MTLLCLPPAARADATATEDFFVTRFPVLSSEEHGADRRTSLSLLDRARNQDQEAWKRLVYLYTPLAFHWCHQAGLHGEDADEVWQGVLVTVAARLDSFEWRKEGSFRCWLWSITRSRIVDLLRSRDLQGQGGTTALGYLEKILAPTPRDSSAGDREEIDGLYRRALELVQRDFEETTWKAFQGHVLEGRRAAEVAAEIGLSANAVRLAKARVLKRLRDEFRDFLE